MKAVRRQCPEELREGLVRPCHDLQDLGHRHRPVPAQLVVREDHPAVLLAAKDGPDLVHRARDNGSADLCVPHRPTRGTDNVLQAPRGTHGRHDNPAAVLRDDVLRDEREAPVPEHERPAVIHKDRTVRVPIMGDAEVRVRLLHRAEEGLEVRLHGLRRASREPAVRFAVQRNNVASEPRGEGGGGATGRAVPAVNDNSQSRVSNRSRVHPRCDPIKIRPGSACVRVHMAHGTPARKRVVLREKPCLDPLLFWAGEFHPEAVHDLDSVELRRVVARRDDDAAGERSRVDEVLEGGRRYHTRILHIVARRQEAGDDGVPQHRSARARVPPNRDRARGKNGADGLPHTQGEIHRHVLADDAPDAVRPKQPRRHAIRSRITRRPEPTRAPSPTMESSTTAPGPTVESSPMTEPRTTPPASMAAPSSIVELDTVPSSTRQRGPMTTLGPIRPDATQSSGMRTAPSTFARPTFARGPTPAPPFARRIDIEAR